MISRDNTVWVWAAAASAAGLAAWALYSFLPMYSDSPQAGVAGAPVNLGGATPGPAAVNTAPSAPPVAPVTYLDRFKLVGVMISGSERRVLISVDGRPAGMYQVGETVDGNTVVREVSERGVTLGRREGGTPMALEMSLAPSVRTLPVSQNPSVTDSVQTLDALRNFGTKHPPLPSRNESVPQKPVDGTAAPVDDGRWRPPGQQ